MLLSSDVFTSDGAPLIAALTSGGTLWQSQKLWLWSPVSWHAVFVSTTININWLDLQPSGTMTTQKEPRGSCLKDLSLSRLWKRSRVRSQDNDCFNTVFLIWCLLRPIIVNCGRITLAVIMCKVAACSDCCLLSFHLQKYSPLVGSYKKTYHPFRINARFPSWLSKCVKCINCSWS